MSRALNLAGQRFGRLVAVEATDERRKGCIVWRCRCDCGRECFATSKNLRYGAVQSCGCIRAENLHTIPRDVKLGQVDGTNVSRIRSTAPQRNNSTGVRGVSETKDGRFEAYIYFKRKKMRIGFFDSLDEAAAARKRAEEQIFKPFLDAQRRKALPETKADPTA